MKIYIVYLLPLAIIFSAHQIVAQNMALGLKGGAFKFNTAAIDGSLGIGPTFGIYLDYAPFENSDNFSISLDVGTAFYDNFPSYYGGQQALSQHRGVHKEAEAYILTLNFEEALLLGWDSRSNFYIQPMLKYYFPLVVFNTKIGLVGGGMLYKRQLTSFSLADFTYSNSEGRVVDFMPGFQVINTWQFAVSVGLTLKQQITPKMFVEIEGLWGSQTPGEDFADEFITLRVGIARSLNLEGL